ncbi:hypothetical protein SRABI112_01410 [Pseudomonas mediterranea]|nr:hypothetical protein SRABI112_01410 [Pseudomonas mediterranea]
MLSIRDMGNVHRHVLDLGVQQLSLAGEDTHTAVFDEDIATDLAHRRPTGLEGQFGVMHLEEQADAAGRVLGAVVQRALVLEKPFIHGTLDDGRAQPLIQGRAQHRRQVLAGVAPVAVHQTDPEVHVVFLAVIEMQADQEIAGNPALLPQHLQVGRDQGETLLVELPGQPRIGLQVLPGLGEDRVQVQGKILAVHAQLAATEVAAETARNVTRRRRAVIGIEAHRVQVGGKADLASTGILRPVVHPHVAQRASEPETVDGRRDALGQRRQGIEQRRNRSQVETIGL